MKAIAAALEVDRDILSGNSFHGYTAEQADVQKRYMKMSLVSIVRAD